MARNPFIPGDPINNPSDFIGRKGHLLAALDSISNNRNVIITGGRGIGKTSLADQILKVIQGQHTAIYNEEKFQKLPRFNAVAGIFSNTKDSTLLQISEGLLNSLRRNRIKPSLNYKAEINLGIFKGTVELKDINEKSSAITTWFIGELINFIKAEELQQTLICLYIDEIDVLKGDVDIGSFVKTTKEHLRAEGYENIVFILVGQSGAVYALIQNHPSVGRTLTTIDLPKMTDNEILNIIQRGEIKGGIKFDDGVKKSIISISKGFPSVTQLICYNCYFIDSDSFIDHYDFENALKSTSDKLKTERYINDNLDLDKHQLALKILEYLCDSDKEFVELESIHGTFISQYSESEINSELRLLDEVKLTIRIDEKLIHLRDKLISVYFHIKNLKQRTTDIIIKTIKILEKKNYVVQFIGNEIERDIDLIGVKKDRFLLIIPIQIKYGFSCVADSEIISNEFINHYKENIGAIVKKYSLDEMLIISEKPLRGNVQIQVLAERGVKFFTLEELENMDIDNY